MGVIGHHRIRGPAGVIDLPVVTPGDGPGPSILRTRVAAGVGQFGLVARGDVRGTGYTVQTHRGLFVIAKDVRTEISYSPNKSVSVNANHQYSGMTNRVLLGRTYFNRATRIEASLRVGANSFCSTWDVDAHWESTTGYGWIEAVGPTTRASGTVSVTAAGHHPGASSWWQTGWVYTTGSVAVDVPAGQYDVYLYVKFTWGGTQHSGSAGEAEAVCLTWKEIARD